MVLFGVDVALALVARPGHLSHEVARRLMDHKVLIVLGGTRSDLQPLVYGVCVQRLRDYFCHPGVGVILRLESVTLDAVNVTLVDSLFGRTVGYGLY